MTGILARYVCSEVGKTFAAALVVLSFVFAIGSLYELVRISYSMRQIAVVLPYVFLSAAEETGLRQLAVEGARVSARDLPNARSVTVEQMLEEARR